MSILKKTEVVAFDVLQYFYDNDHCGEMTVNTNGSTMPVTVMVF